MIVIQLPNYAQPHIAPIVVARQAPPVTPIITPPVLQPMPTMHVVNGKVVKMTDNQRQMLETEHQLWGTDGLDAASHVAIGAMALGYEMLKLLGYILVGCVALGSVCLLLGL